MFLRPARDPHGIPGVKKFRVVPGNLRTDKTRHVEGLPVGRVKYRAISSSFPARRRYGARPLNPGPEVACSGARLILREELAPHFVQ